MNRLQHAYCTGCQARVTVRDQACLLGHAVDPSTISNTRGHRVARHPRRTPVPAGAISRSLVEPDPAPPPVPTRSRPEPPPPVVSIGGYRLEETRFLIQDLWNSQEHLVEWRGQLESIAPGEEFVECSGLMRRLGMVAVALATVAVAWASYRGLTAEHGTQIDRLALEQAVTDLGPVLDDFGDGVPIDQLQTPVALDAADNVAKRQYAAAASLDDPATRSEIVTQAGTLIDVVGYLRQVNAYQASLGPFLVMPNLPADASPDQMAELGETLAIWQVELEGAFGVLPTHPRTVQHAETVERFLAGIDRWKAEYLAAVRDRQPTDQYLESLGGEIAALQTGLDQLLAETADQARTDLG